MGGYELGPYFCDNPHHALLHHVLENLVGRYPRDIYDSLGGAPVRTEYGMALEFGVGEGHSLRCIARYLPVIGYDSFDGLPEDWRPGFEAGMFKSDPPSPLPANADIVEGLFDETLPDFDPNLTPARVRLIHIDCDLYSSTKTVLERCMGLFTPGLVVVFDEWWGYPEAELHEQRAFREFVDVTAFDWRVIGHGVQQWAIEVIK